VFWGKIGLENLLDIGCAEGLAGKDIQVHVICLFHEMCTDVGGLNELDKGISLLVARSKENDLGLSVGHHVDFLHKILCEIGDGFGRANCGWTALARIQNQMISPMVHVF
jgi:hypothetical protein